LGKGKNAGSREEISFVVHLEGFEDKNIFLVIDIQSRILNQHDM